MPNFEQALQQSMFQGNAEKTFIDKILAKDDVNAIRELVKKPVLSRSDILEILYLLTSTESKLVNYGEWERYVILKYFVWLREFVKVAELLFDYQDELNRKTHVCGHCKKYFIEYKQNGKTFNKECVCEKPIAWLTITDRAQRNLDNNQRLIEHNVKFLIDLYLNIARTTLSIGATGLLELLKSKFEVAYTGEGFATQQPQENKTKLMGMKR